MKRTKRQLTIEALTRLIDQSIKIESALAGYDDALAKEMKDNVRWSLENRRRKLLANEKAAA